MSLVSEQERMQLRERYGLRPLPNSAIPTQPKITAPVKQAPVVTAAPVPKQTTFPDGKQYTNALDYTKQFAPETTQVPKTQAEKPMAMPQPQSMKPDAPKSFAGKTLNFLEKGLAAVGGYADAKVKYQEQQMKSGVNPYGNFGINELKAEVAGVKGIIPGIKNNTYPSVALQGIADRTPSPIVKKIASNPVTKFAADTLADPTNVIPIERIASVAAKVPGIKQVVKGTEGVVKAVKEIPAVKSAATELALRFAKEKVVPKSVLTAFEGIGHKFSQQAPKVVEDIKKVYEGLDNKEVEAVADALNIKPLNKGKGTFKGYKEIMDRVGKEAWDTRVAPAIDATQDIFKRELDDQLERKLITKKWYTQKLTEPYYHAIDLERNKVASALERIFGKHGQTYRGYMKKKTGALEFSKNARVATIERDLRQLEDNLVDDALLEIRKNFGKRNKKMAEEGWVAVDSDKLHGAVKKLRGYYFPPEVGKYINQVYTKTPWPMKVLAEINRIWKPGVTKLNPKYVANNIVGNISLSHIAGLVSPERIKQSILGGFSPDEMELINKSGLFDTGQTLNDVRGLYDEFLTNPNASRLDRLNLGGDKGPLNILSRISRASENNTRGAVFLDTYEKMLKMGENADDAMRLAKEHANKHLFDYRNGLTPFESRYMKNIVPFYTFARKNIPLQIESFYKNTGKMTQQMKFVAAANGGELPSEDGLTIPFTDDGQGNRRRLRVALPMNDILDPKAGEDTIVGGQTKKALGMMNPYLKAGLEGITSLGKGENPQDWYTGDNITDRQKPIILGKDSQALDWLKYLTLGQTAPYRSYKKAVKDPSTKNIFESFFIPGIVKKPRKDQAILDAIYKKKDQDRFRRDQLLRR